MTGDDTRLVDQGVEWVVRRAKNGQLGRGETGGAARKPNPRLCPATALQVWQATLAGLLGREPRSDAPVFVRLDRHLDPPEPSPEPAHPRSSNAPPAPPASSATTPATPYGPGSSATPSTPALPGNKSNATVAGPTSEASTPTTARPRAGDRPTLPAPCPARQGHQLTVHGAVRFTGWSSIASSRPTAPIPGTRTPRRGSGDSPGVPLARR
jgi:hypothetical protein